MGAPCRSAPSTSLRILNADIIALQEVVGAGPSNSGHAEEIGAALGMGWVMAPVRHLHGHQFGNVVLSHFPIRQHYQYQFMLEDVRSARLPAGRYRRSTGKTLHILTLPVLGTAYRERKDQAKRLATIVHDRRISGAENSPG